MILKSILLYCKIQIDLVKEDLMPTGFIADHSRERLGFDSLEEHRSFLLFALILLNKVMENKSFFSISCQGTKTAMLLPHTNMIIEQCPTAFCLVH